VSEPLFLVDELPDTDEYTLDGPEGHHAATVARLRVGERVLLGDGRGGVARAEVDQVGRGAVGLRILGRFFTELPRPSLVVVQALPKGERGELAVQMMTEVGVDTVVPWAARHCVAVWRGERGGRSRQRWIDTAREAAKQARRPWLPTVDPLAGLDEVVARVRMAALSLVLHEEASEPMSEVVVPSDGEVVLVVGPEGGIAPEELTALREVGGRAVRLGTTVLRTSTAGVAALVVAAVRSGRW
jgi:16S rRNA (uracil1498-N3)-methyltransferase